MSDRAQKRPKSERVTDSDDEQNITQSGEDHGGTTSGTARDHIGTDSEATSARGTKDSAHAQRLKNGS